MALSATSARWAASAAFFTARSAALAARSAALAAFSPAASAFLRRSRRFSSRSGSPAGGFFSFFSPVNSRCTSRTMPSTVSDMLSITLLTDSLPRSGPAKRYRQPRNSPMISRGIEIQNTRMISSARMSTGMEVIISPRRHTSN